jgi:hypothetical protein
MSSWIPGRTGYDNLTTEATMQGPEAVSLAWIEAPAQPTSASESVADILVAMPSLHSQSSELFEVVNIGIRRRS